jgi:hypothetical protein
MKAFMLSGEKAAVDDSEIFRAEMVGAMALDPFTTYTWFGVWSVSEKMARFPLGETASTLPVTVPRGLKGLVCDPRFVGFITWAPKSLPTKNLSPAGVESMEFGVTGMGLADPVAALPVEKL